MGQSVLTPISIDDLLEAKLTVSTSDDWNAKSSCHFSSELLLSFFHLATGKLQSVSQLAVVYVRVCDSANSDGFAVIIIKRV